MKTFVYFIESPFEIGLAFSFLLKSFKFKPFVAMQRNRSKAKRAFSPPLPLFHVQKQCEHQASLPGFGYTCVDQTS